MTLAVVLLAAGCGGGHSTTTIIQTVTNPPSTTTASAPSFTGLVSSVRTGVVRIETTTCSGGEIGTGFLVAPRLVATVEHVVDGATSITVKQSGKVVATGTVVGSDTFDDLALVKLSAPLQGHVFTLAPSTPQLGEGVAAIGFPLGLPLTVTRGSVSGLHRKLTIAGIRRRQLVQTDAAVNPGNSGGPLLDANTGDVLGLVDLGTDAANGIAFAVSAQQAAPELAGWKASPQTVSLVTCSGVGGGVGGTAPTSSNAVQQYSGAYFSVSYPRPWSVTAADQPLGGGAYIDTQIADPTEPSILVRIDVTPGGAASPSASYRKLSPVLASEAGYNLIAADSTTRPDGSPAFWWEFKVDENGVPMHKVDEFFNDSHGNSYAVLTQSPVSETTRLLTRVFTAVRATLAPN